ncbi:MAG: AAA family ATPase [Pseudomonadota bacterium]
MYYDYFGLKQAPFKITPDTSLFFPGGDRGAILDALIYAIVSGEGIVKLVGEVGSGKTTLCRMLEKELPENVEIVYLANPSLSPDNILHAIAFELKLKVRPDDSRLKVMNSLQNYLLERHAENKQIVVFVEEAQSMPIATLEEIRLLSNLETAQNKLLQIAIFGQPELDVMISKPEIRQLKERITYSFYLSPFKPDEVKDYINSRLRSCGYRSVELFNDSAIKTISKYSNGLLRRINILSDKALLACYADNQNIVSVKHVKLAAKETEFVGKTQFPFIRWGFTGVLIIAAGVLILSISGLNLSILDFNKIKHEEESITTVIENTETLTTSANNSLMLVKEAREIESDLPQVDTVNDIIEESIIEPDNNVVENEIIESDLEQEEIFVAKPDPAEFEKTQWQVAEHTAFFYPEIESIVETLPQENEGISETGLMEIRDLIKAVSGHGKNDMALLNQLTILPSETAINHETVAGDLTCELCSTIIYRPLKDDKNL